MDKPWHEMTALELGAAMHDLPGISVHTIAADGATTVLTLGGAGVALDGRNVASSGELGFGRLAAGDAGGWLSSGGSGVTGGTHPGGGPSPQDPPPPEGGGAGVGSGGGGTNPGGGPSPHGPPPRGSDIASAADPPAS